MKTSLLALWMVALLAGAALAQGVQPLAMPDEIAAPKDVAYPGTMRLHVDATDTARHIYRVRQTIPVAAAGSMPILRNSTSMRRLPSLLRTVLSQAASPAKPTLSAAVKGSSESLRSASLIVCCGVGFQTGVWTSCRKPAAP